MRYVNTILVIALLASVIQVSGQQIPSYKAESLMARTLNNDTLYVVNFWATWCGPCITELPEFDKLSAMYAGMPVKILLVSLDFKSDYPNKILKFISKKRLKHEVIWLNETDANQFIPKIDSEWQGSIPATLIVYQKRNYRLFFEGMITATRLKVLLDKQLSAMY